MNNISTFSKLLRLRNTVKKLQQVSWTVSKLERKFDLDKLSEEQLLDLCTAYLDLIPQVKLILDELLAENENKNHTN